jgi:hypothetical protein
MTLTCQTTISVGLTGLCPYACEQKVLTTPLPKEGLHTHAFFGVHEYEVCSMLSGIGQASNREGSNPRDAWGSGDRHRIPHYALVV